MGNIITISGQKGGEGKSVIAVNLAASLAVFGKNVLLVDTDPRGCSTKWSGVKDYSFDLASLLTGKVQIEKVIWQTGIKGLSVLPCGFDLFYVAQNLSRISENEKMLGLFLDEVRPEYDFVIIDSPSSYGFLPISAQVAADGLILPLTAFKDAADTIRCQLKLIQYIRNTHGTSLKLSGILRNHCTDQESGNALFDDQSMMDIKNLIFKTIIPEDEGVRAAADRGCPLVLYDIKTPGAQGFLDFSKEVLLAFK